LLVAEYQRLVTDVRTIGNLIFRDHPYRAEADHLESSAVSQYSAVPVHEAVQPPRLQDDFVPRAEVQMVRVGQNDPASDLLQLLGAHRLHGGLGAHRHEHRGLKGSVRSVEPRQAGSRLLAHLDQFIPNSQELRLPLVPLYLTTRSG